MAMGERRDQARELPERAETLRLDALVPAEFADQRVDAAAARMFGESSGISRSDIARWLKSGALTLDGRVVKPKTPVAEGQRLAATIERAPRFDWQAAEPLDFPIVFEDEAVIVVDKPPGLVVHPGAGNPRGTLVNGLLHHRPALATLPRAGLVHRLDKDTSGLMVVAATATAQARLIAAMGDRRIERRYLAIAEGRVIADQRVELPIGRDPRNRLRQAVRTDGRPAATRFSVRQRFAVHTFIEAELETGRTHQVRVHLASLGHPLVGDRVYGARGVVPPTANAAEAQTVRGFPRQALHAAALAFDHPLSATPLRFAAALPSDMADLLQALSGERRSDSSARQQ